MVIIVKIASQKVQHLCETGSWHQLRVCLVICLISSARLPCAFDVVPGVGLIEGCIAIFIVFITFFNEGIAVVVAQAAFVSCVPQRLLPTPCRVLGQPSESR